MKTCSRCGEDRETEFYASYKGNRCKACLRAYVREWKRQQQLREPERVQEARRRYYHADLERSREYARGRRRLHPEKFAEYTARRVEKDKALGRHAFYAHGVTPEQRTEIEAAQGGLCAICDCDLTQTARPCIDHEHPAGDYRSGGPVRGILCGKCNASLGWFEARRERIEWYLSRPPVHPGRTDRADRRLKPPLPLNPPPDRRRQLAEVCRKGHPMVPENVYRFNNGARACRACTIERARAKWWREHPGEPEPKPRRKVWHRGQNICKKGHELTADNVYANKATGHRKCKKCTSEYVRERWRAAHPDAPRRV